MGRRHRVASAGIAALVMAGFAVQSAAAAPHGPVGRQQAFTDAAAEFHVPKPVLMAVAYNISRFEQHGGSPSTTGAYGVMGLTDVPGGAARGEAGPAPSSASLHTLTTAAHLVDTGAARVKADDVMNIRAGAALLAQYARDLDHGSLPSSIGGWYGAVEKYAQTPDARSAGTFAGDVFSTIRAGASERTSDGSQVTLAASPSVRPDTASAAALTPARPAAGPAPECPPGLSCDFVPAAYQQNSDAAGDYGNYDTADRPKQLKIDQIVLHDTEEYYDETLGIFTDPASYTSAHYVIRSADGHVTQMVRTKDVAWQAGNWYTNAHSVGIEQEGFAIKGATWFTEPLYHSSARLVRYLAAKYNVPLDRQHIIGHDNVPGIDPAHVATMHWDPGPFWDWSHYMTLLGRPILPGGTSHSPVVTINPDFDRNVQTVTDCEGDGSAVTQASSFVTLRTAPSADAPLASDPALHPDGSPGTTCANDWGDKASAGQKFAVAGRHGDWTAIWFDGQKVWFQGKRAATPTYSVVVTPRPGVDSIPTYGRAYPESSAYPADIPDQGVAALQYRIKAGQSYATTLREPSTDYYYAKTIDSSLPDDHTVVHGKTRYLLIQLGHRVGYVKASDVRVRLLAG